VKGNNNKTSFFILYDQLRWEEKSLIEAAKKRDINLEVSIVEKIRLSSTRINPSIATTLSCRDV